MNCPACGSENVNGAQQCISCGRALRASHALPATVDVRISRIAIASAICAFISAVFFLPGLLAWLDPTVLHPQSGVARLTGLATFLATGSAFVLGVAGLAEIATSGGRRTGYLFAILGAVAPCFLVMGLLCVPTFAGAKYSSQRMVCGANLSGIGKAMLIYANDFENRLPVAGGPNAHWVARLPRWAAENRVDAYGLSDPNAGGGQASVSASLYLLVKYGGLNPKMFVCRNDGRTVEFSPARYRARDRDLTSLWDFGPNPSRHCSYAYHMPYGQYSLTTSLPPGLAVAADRNPWIDSPFVKAREFSRYKPDMAPFNGNSSDARQGNAITHFGDGQNVLFLDSHAEFAKRAFCGLDDDNIYTLWNGNDKVRGTPPKFGSQPANTRDSLLVNDPVAR